VGAPFSCNTHLAKSVCFPEGAHTEWRPYKLAWGENVWSSRAVVRWLTRKVRITALEDCVTPGCQRCQLVWVSREKRRFVLLVRGVRCSSTPDASHSTRSSCGQGAKRDHERSLTVTCRARMPILTTATLPARERSFEIAFELVTMHYFHLQLDVGFRNRHKLLVVSEIGARGES
jgi:hypothetical protein